MYHARGDMKTCSSSTNKYARGGVCVRHGAGATQPHRRYVVGKVELMKLSKEECAVEAWGKTVTWKSLFGLNKTQV